MRKINVVYDGKDAILKIKDESLVLTLEEEIIKIPYTNIKNYSYDEKNEAFEIIRHGGSKISINMKKDIELFNRIDELKNEASIVKEQEKSISNEKVEKYVDTTFHNNSDLGTNTTENNNINNTKISITSVFIVLLIILVPIIVFWVKINNSTKDKNKISGCYYIVNNLTEKLNENVSLCIDEETVDYTINGHTTTLYIDFTTDTYLDIDNNYGETMFECNIDIEDFNNMKCKSYNKALGSGTWVWKKK